MKKIVLLTITMYVFTLSVASSQKVDTVIVELAGSSKMVFTIGDRKDLLQLRRYDFQGLMNDIMDNLENGDSLQAPLSERSDMDESEDADMENAEDNEMDEDDEDDEDEDEMDEDDQDDEDDAYEEDEDNDEDDSDDPCDDCDDDRDNNRCRTFTSFNFDFGINNFLENGRFPDDHNAQYTVHPWGSWYVGINSTLHTDLGQQFFIEWGLGVSWYNFKFQDNNTLITKGENGVVFSQDQRDLNFNLSKLSATYLNASVIPMFATGRNHHHNRWWNHGHDSFRIGAGPYVGYRLESHSKQVYTISGEKEVEKERDNFYLNNLRYGVKLQMGFQDIDFFAAYDINSFFVEGKGPNVNAFTIGVVF